jgi:hypothetical protein
MRRVVSRDPFYPVSPYLPGEPDLVDDATYWQEQVQGDIDPVTGDVQPIQEGRSRQIFTGSSQEEPQRISKHVADLGHAAKAPYFGVLTECTGSTT